MILCNGSFCCKKKKCILVTEKLHFLQELIQQIFPFLPILYYNVHIPSSCNLYFPLCTLYSLCTTLRYITSTPHHIYANITSTLTSHLLLHHIYSYTPTCQSWCDTFTRSRHGDATRETIHYSRTTFRISWMNEFWQSEVDLT